MGRGSVTHHKRCHEKALSRRASKAPTMGSADGPVAFLWGLRTGQDPLQSPSLFMWLKIGLDG